MTSYDPEILHKLLLGAIELAVGRRRASINVVLGDTHRKLYPELRSGHGRVTQACLDYFISENEDWLPRKLVGDLRAAFPAYEQHMSALPDARRNRLLPQKQMKLTAAREILLSNFPVESLKHLRLATDEGLNALLHDGILSKAYCGNYGPTINIGQSVIELAARKPVELDLKNSRQQGSVVAHASLSLAWVGVQAKSPRLTQWAVEKLEPYKNTDRFCRAAYWHIRRYQSSGRDAELAAQKAFEALRERSKTHFPVSQNFERSIAAAYILHGYVRQGKSLDTKIEELGSATVRESLDDNIEQAAESDRAGSEVVARVQKSEALLAYGERSDAQDEFFRAFMANKKPDQEVQANKELLDNLAAKIADAEDNS